MGALSAEMAFSRIISIYYSDSIERLKFNPARVDNIQILTPGRNLRDLFPIRAEELH